MPEPPDTPNTGKATARGSRSGNVQPPRHVLKQTRFDTPAGEVLVSTISLAVLDDEVNRIGARAGWRPLFGPRSKPFETALFREDREPEIYVFASEDEAIARHEDLVRQVALLG